MFKIKDKKFSQLWHTVKYLRSLQIYYRLYYILFKFSSKNLSSFHYHPRQWKLIWSSPWHCLPAITEDGTFSLFGELGSVNNKEDWNDPSKSNKRVACF